METVNNHSMKDFIVTFFIGKHITTKLLSEIINNRDNKLFMEELGLPRDFILPFFQEKGRNSLVYSLKQDEYSRYEATLDDEICFDHSIQSGDYISFRDLEGNHSFNMLFIDSSDVPISYKKLSLPKNKNVFIGRNPGNDITYSFNNMISRDKHLAIQIDGQGNATLEDLKRNIGVYVNGQLVHHKKLELFDEIYMMGLSMIYLGDSLAVRDFMVDSSLPMMRSYPAKAVQPDSQKEKEFVRSPRILKSIKTEEIEIDGPPNPKAIDKTPAILALGPSLTMSLVMIASLSITIVGAINGGNIATVVGSAVMALGMLTGALLWPTLLRNYQKKQHAEEEELRKKKYIQYIGDIEKKLVKLSNRSVSLLNNTLEPAPNALCAMLDNESNKLRLWERSYQDNDFLAVRVGLGERPLAADIRIPKKSFQLLDDELRDLPDILVDRYSTLEDVPISLDIHNNKTVGIIGSDKNVQNVLDEILLNIISLHSYDEVKLVLVTSPKKAEQFSAYKDIPHLWSNDKKIRYFATNPEEVHHVFSAIDEIVKEREGLREGTVSIPHYVFLITDPSLIEKEALLRYIDNAHNNVGITTLFAYGDISKLPKSVETIIQSDQTRTGFYIKNQNENKFTEFTLDRIDQKKLQNFTDNLTKLEIKRDVRTLSIPDSISFLQMYHAGNISELNIERNWESNNSSRSLAVPVGLMAGGETFNLDLHESYHGSHGLVAGTTGSGKSEFLQAFVLSLAINYSPKEVAFVLVDFKGGDMARPFMEKPDSPALPHLAATISNLTDNILYRALVSFEAEIKYRQRLFNEAAAQLGVDKLDINSYHRYFKSGKLNVPLPHMIIIIDEFAQLKTQHPEFLTQLNNIAQVGRSLGIHLILATQKPSGLVDPQVWSNSRFKICLKVADKQDSIDMISRPDSAMIKNPGRFYVQIGYDEIFECVQSGYSGANYAPTETFIPEDEITIQLTDHTANPIYSAKLDITQGSFETTQLEATVAEIISLGQKKNYAVKPLWLEMLPEKVYLNELEKGDRGIASATLGLVDYIKTQEQKPLKIDLAETGHIALYGASGTGKTTFLQTLIYSLINDNHYTPEELNIYALDFGGRNLGYLENLPHTGGVVYSDQEDKLEELIDVLSSTIDERKILFAENNVGTFTDYKEVAENDLPMILVLVDNYQALHEKFINLSEEMLEIISSGRTFGIYFVVTGSTRNAIHYKAAEHISTNFTLKMNDPLNYLDILNVRPPIVPEDVNGRGITVIDKEVVEFQTALALKSENEAERVSKIVEAYKKIDQDWKGYRPVKLGSGSVERKPEREETVRPRSTYSGSSASVIKKPEPVQNDQDHVIVGTSRSGTLSYGYPVDESFHLSLMMDGSDDLKKTYENLIENILSSENRRVVFIDDDSERFSSLQEKFKDITYLKNIEELDGFIEELRPQLNARLAGDEDVVAEKLFVIVGEFNSVFDMITDEQAAFLRKVQKFIDKPEHGLQFITGFDVNGNKSNDSLFLSLIVKAGNHLIGPNSYNQIKSKIENFPIIDKVNPYSFYFSTDGLTTDIMV